MHLRTCWIHPKLGETNLERNFKSSQGIWLILVGYGTFLSPWIYKGRYTAIRYVLHHTATLYTYIPGPMHTLHGTPLMLCCSYHFFETNKQHTSFLTSVYCLGTNRLCSFFISIIGASFASGVGKSVREIGECICFTCLVLGCDNEPPPPPPHTHT